MLLSRELLFSLPPLHRCVMFVSTIAVKVVVVIFIIVVMIIINYPVNASLL